jgi:Beta-lactamase enzyme family
MRTLRQVGSPLFGSIETALIRLYDVEDPPAEWFSGALLASVPLEAIAKALLRSKQEGGKLCAVSAEGPAAELEFTHGKMSAQVLLDEQGRIATLFLGPVRPARIGVDEVARRLDELAGETSIHVAHNGRQVVALHADREMAVASCFKLGVVLAVQDRVDRGELAWDQVVRLEPRWRSLPSGMLQDWPAGTAVTLETLAALALSWSDNTATDALMDIVGRAHIERGGYLRTPVLSTREVFVLRDPANADLLQEYGSSDITLKRAAMAACRDRSLPSYDVITTQSRDKNAATEWYSTAHDLARLVDRVSDVQIATLGRSPIPSRAWSRVTAKLGREPGVVACAATLEHDDGRRFSLAVIWNALASGSDLSEPEDLMRLVPALADALADQAPSGS